MPCGHLMVSEVSGAGPCMGGLHIRTYAHMHYTLHTTYIPSTIYHPPSCVRNRLDRYIPTHLRGNMTGSALPAARDSAGWVICCWCGAMQTTASPSRNGLVPASSPGVKVLDLS